MFANVTRFTIFLSIFVAILSLWDHPYLTYIKQYVVFIHELCHAIATLLTGGEVKNIQIHSNESGETIATVPGGNWSFLFIVSAGYVGTALLGGFLLFKGIKGEASRVTLILFALVVLILSIQYTKNSSLAYNIGFYSSIFLIGVSFLGKTISSIVLVFLGTSLSIYSIYDLSDFMENVHNTDAGILAYYLTGLNPENVERIPPSVVFLGHLIGIAWSLISIYLIYNFILKSFRSSYPVESEPNASLSGDSIDDNYNPPNENPLATGMFPGEITPEVLEWFLSKGLDLHGNPIQGPFNINYQEKIDGISPNSEMS